MALTMHVAMCSDPLHYSIHCEIRTLRDNLELRRNESGGLYESLNVLHAYQHIQAAYDAIKSGNPDLMREAWSVLRTFNFSFV